MLTTNTIFSKKRRNENNILPKLWNNVQLGTIYKPNGGVAETSALSIEDNILWVTKGKIVAFSKGYNALRRSISLNQFISNKLDTSTFRVVTFMTDALKDISIRVYNDIILASNLTKIVKHTDFRKFMCNNYSVFCESNNLKRILNNKWIDRIVLTTEQLVPYVLEHPLQEDFVRLKKGYVEISRISPQFYSMSISNKTLFYSYGRIVGFKCVLGQNTHSTMFVDRGAMDSLLKYRKIHISTLQGCCCEYRMISPQHFKAFVYDGIRILCYVAIPNIKILNDLVIEDIPNIHNAEGNEITENYVESLFSVSNECTD